MLGRFRLELALALSTALSRMSRILRAGSGSVVGGRVALAVDPGLIGKLCEGKRVVLVSGTNGKTTTTRMVAVALAAAAGPERRRAEASGGALERAGAVGGVAISRAGANLPFGIATALGSARHATQAALEVDERYLPALIDASRPEVVVLLNLTRDQLDRVGEVKMTADRWRSALRQAAAADGNSKRLTVVANADDPMVVWAASVCESPIWVSAGQGWRGDSMACPACGGSISFSAASGIPGPPGSPAVVPTSVTLTASSTYPPASCDTDHPASDSPSAFVDWRCSCGMRRPSPAVMLDGERMVLPRENGSRWLPLRLSMPGGFNRSNACMAVAAAGVLGVPPTTAVEAISGLADVEGRFSQVEVNGRAVRLMLAKNPAGWNEILAVLQDRLSGENVRCEDVRWTSERKAAAQPRPVSVRWTSERKAAAQPRPVSVRWTSERKGGGVAKLGAALPVAVIGINARVADGRDTSWLWDVPFERLEGYQVVATGERCYDLAVRLSYAGIGYVCAPDQLDALRSPTAVGEGGSGELVYVGNYTAFQQMRKRISRNELSDSAVGVVGRPGAPEGLGARAESVEAEMAEARTEGAEGEGEGALPLTKGAVPGRAGTAPGGRRLESRLRIIHLYPDLLSTYGDGGNPTIIERRAHWRGMATELVTVAGGDPIPESGDIYCLGGGEDSPQAAAAAFLREPGNREALSRAIERGAAVLAVCAGYQILGEAFPGASGVILPGAGILPALTAATGMPRSVGELAVVPSAELLALGGFFSSALSGAQPSLLTGFENHAGRTRLVEDAVPLGTVVAGVGNGWEGRRDEGVLFGHAIGTYMHGPVLARNPQIGDLLLSLATGCAAADLAPIGPEEHELLRRERVAQLGRGALRRSAHLRARRL